MFPEQKTGFAFAGENNEAEPVFNYDNETPHSDEESEQTDYKEESPLAPGWSVLISQKIPTSAQHIGLLIRGQILSQSSMEPYEEILDKMEAAEREFFGNKEMPLFNWNELTVIEKFRASGFKVRSSVRTIIEKRRITYAEIRRWFDTESSAYGRAMQNALGSADLQKLIMLLESASQSQIFNWQTQVAFFCISAPDNAM